MTDVVIPLGKSRIDYMDLRFCLRSFEKYGVGLGNVYIVGEKPKWITNVVHIPVTDNPHEEWKERNIWLKVRRACEEEGLSDNFIYTNDDHVLLRETELSNYPNYYKGSCYGSMQRNKSTYRATMNHTRKLLAAMGREDMNADGHCPIIFNKEKFINTFDDDFWDVEYGYGMKSVYCAVNKCDMMFMSDLKIHKSLSESEATTLTEGRHVMSFTDGGFKCGVHDFLNKKLNFKSKYEC